MCCVTTFLEKRSSKSSSLLGCRREVGLEKIHTYASICVHVEVGCRCVSVSESRLRDRGRGSYHRVIIERGMLGKDTL